MEFGPVVRTGTWDISILTQAPKSPDTNVCDLSFFRALKSKQWRSGVEDTIKGLISEVLRAFESFDERKNDFGFLTLQCCLDDILICNGGNDYSIRHMGKERMLREGILPERIEASEAAVRTFNFVTNPPHLRDDDENQGEDDNNLQEQQPQQMINKYRNLLSGYDLFNINNDGSISEVTDRMIRGFYNFVAINKNYK